MQSRQLTAPFPAPPSAGRPSTSHGHNGSTQNPRYKTPREQKVYYIPPPPPSTFHRDRRAPVVPVYAHNNNSYHSDLGRSALAGANGNGSMGGVGVTTTISSDAAYNSPGHGRNNSGSTTGNPTKKTPFPFRTRTASNVSSSTTSSSSTLAANDSSLSTESNKTPDHDILPPPPPGVPTSRYIHMLLSIDSIPKIYNLLAAFSTWILLAGYVLLPGTFTSLQNLPTSSNPDSDNEHDDPPNAIQSWILDRVRNTPLLYIAAVCSALGVIGMSLLWFRWRRNYVWIINRIFLPGTLNSLAGIISTIVNVHTAQQGKYSLTAIVSITVTAVSTVINGTLWLVYSNWALKRVQEMHAREYFGGKKDEEARMELGESGGLVEVHDGLEDDKKERS